jgi:hypothetical protein
MTTKPQESTMTLRFSSSPLVYAPGFIAAMRRVDSLSKEAARTAASLYMLAEAYPQAPAWALLALVEGRYTVEGDSVVVSDEPATKYYEWERKGVPATIAGIATGATESTVIGGAL